MNSLLFVIIKFLNIISYQFILKYIKYKPTSDMTLAFPLLRFEGATLYKDFY